MTRGYRQFGQVTRHGKGYGSVHVVDTEAQTLDDALRIIDAQQRHKKAADGQRAQREKPPTLRQEFARAKSRSTMLHRNGKISLAGTQQQRNPHLLKKPTKGRHPFRDLPEAEMIEKAREMWASGHWGCGNLALYRLSRAFGVTKGQFVEWVEGIIPRM